MGNQRNARWWALGVVVVYLAILASMAILFKASLLVFGSSCILSLIAFGLYGVDKNAAQQKAWRVSEKNLHFVALLGGWPGALLGQEIFRHKTSKAAFQAEFRVSVALNLVLTTAAEYGLWHVGI
jgi:uncharacterized membrane protein YsdA (DUF1294 family)